MDPEDRALLEKTYELAKENNAILRGMRRSMRWGTIFRALYWVLIIAGIIGTTVYVGPMLQQVYGSYQNVLSDYNGVKQKATQGAATSGGVIEQLQQLLKEAKGQ